MIKKEVPQTLYCHIGGSGTGAAIFRNTCNTRELPPSKRIGV